MNSETHKATALADKTCPHCHQEFPNINPKVFSNHVRWCKQNPDRDRLSGATFHQKIGDINRHKIDLRCGKVKEFTVTCARCGKQFMVKEREKKFPSKERYYCSSWCRHSHEHTPEQRKAISEKNKRRLVEHGKPIHKDVVRICQHCGREFVVNDSRKKRFCNAKCAHQWVVQRHYEKRLSECKTDIEKTKLEIARYREACKFKFSLKQFPDEFDFDLVRKYGWYKAKNHGDNQNGVNRDHMYSVMDGFVNHVDPKIISHPANCQLLLHSANVSKKDKSSITLEELLNRIDRWNKKYKDFQTYQ